MNFSLPPPAAFLPSPGEPPIPWTRWYSNFHVYLTATGFDTEDVDQGRKRAILVHCLGTEGQRIFNALSDTDSYNAAVNALKGQFGKSKSVILQRYQFRKREQHSGESLIEYVATLKALASGCNFGALSDEMIRDQLIEKTNCQRIRERLLMESDDLTLQKAMQIACQVESAMQESHLMKENPLQFNVKKQENSVQHVDNRKVYKKKTNHIQKMSKIQDKHCSRCGSKQHNSSYSDCPAKGHVCYACGKANHFQKACKSKNKNPVQYVTDSQDNKENITSVYTVGTDIDTFKYCNLYINGFKIKFLIDIGAKRSLLNGTLYHELFSSRYPLKRCHETLKGYGGSDIDILGTVELPKVTYGNVSLEKFTFFVSKEGSTLLGVDLFDRLGFSVTFNKANISNIETVDKFESLFEGVGEVRKFQHKPVVNEMVRPISQAYRRLPLSVRESVSLELKRLEDDDIIERVDASPWISNIVIVPKKNNEIRLCIDLRSVNKAIVPDRYPLPTLSELTSEFHGSRVFSKLDLRRSYEQVPLHKDSRYLTAFITHEGVFQFKRVPYGLASAPSCFQKILSSILKDCPGATNNIDDVVVHGKTPDEHDQRLEKVLQKFVAYGLKLNEDKCVFSKSSINFVGHKLSYSGVSPLKSNVEAILRLPEPKNRKELQSFLATTNYYLKFIPNYASKAEPLRKLLRKDVSWTWAEEQRSAVEDLKNRIASPPVLCYFDPESPIVVTTDASNCAIGGVLSQVQDGVERPVAFASKTLNETERKYSTSEREALAAIYMCEHWHMFLYVRPFTLRTDHEALKSLLSTTGSGHRPLRIYRWTDRLLQYNFTVEHISGSRNEVADMLSRLFVDDMENQVASVDFPDVEYKLACGKLVTLADLEKASKDDAELQTVANCIRNGWNDVRKKPDFASFYKVRHELNVWNEHCITRNDRAVIPHELRKQVLEMAHSGHPGIVRMKQRCRECVWWPKLNKHIEEL